jgi:quercetin 2,3-dioxygenase
MLYQRRISRIYNVPELAPGFVGPGHLAAPVIPPEDFAINDPFILLMDDHLDIGDRPVGGAHPHAGFETVTLLLQGSIYDRDEGGFIEAGEVQWMTAGRGIIHGENVGAKGKVRLLQLWLTLPKADRWTEPGFQTIHTDAVLVRRENGAEVRIYSGGSGSFRSTTRNHVPVIHVCSICSSIEAVARKRVLGAFPPIPKLGGFPPRRVQMEVDTCKTFVHRKVMKSPTL